ncbi:MAG: arsenate reductase ArsC [Syntrophobacteraceae bacterium]
MMEQPRLKVLFLCTGNSCRSQMAEAWTRRLRGDLIEAYSAGVAPHAMDPGAIEVMAEEGIDISGYESKHVDSIAEVEFDYVITLCENARETCPFFPARVRVLHVSFDDPPRLASETGTREEGRDIYRRVRDEIRAFVEKLPDFLTQAPKGRE